MWPPKSGCIDEIGRFWTDKELITCLESIQNRSPGASLPGNVLDDVNPYLCEPSSLPPDIWYVIYSKDPKQKVGFWKEIGKPCQIYCDASVIGWRTTLEYEGHSPNRHQWVMQEYSISHKGTSKLESASSLCRVFLSDRAGETPKMNHNQANVDFKGQKNLLHDEANKFGKVLKAEMERYQAECIANGDYLELQDLDRPDPQPSSPSSGNSSCTSPPSDVYFDSDALLKLLDSEEELSQTKPSGHKFSISRPNEIVVAITAEGSSTNATATSTTVEPIKLEGSARVSTLERGLHDKDHIPENAKNPLPPTSRDAGASSSGLKSRADKGKTVVWGKMIKKFFCFLAF